jgi:hypothetical protein
MCCKTSLHTNCKIKSTTLTSSSSVMSSKTSSTVRKEATAALKHHRDDLNSRYFYFPNLHLCWHLLSRSNLFHLSCCQCNWGARVLCDLFNMISVHVPFLILWTAQYHIQCLSRHPTTGQIKCWQCTGSWHIKLVCFECMPTML